MTKQFTVSGITFQENRWIKGENDIILLSPMQYVVLEQLFYLLLKDTLSPVHKNEVK